MALGRQGETHDELMMGWAEMPRSPGHVFYDRLQEVLTASELVPAGFSNRLRKKGLAETSFS